MRVTPATPRNQPGSMIRRASKRSASQPAGRLTNTRTSAMTPITTPICAGSAPRPTM
ncbi:MAG: hypothetical protein M5R40_03260 [Anaerolineae bacterium]|nr:hypothetical protein [Anaerolineae bacterium]